MTLPFSPDVTVVLQDFLAEIQQILGDRLLGMYLSGSLALGDFAPSRSDIDVVVVTTEDVGADRFRALQTMHARFNASDSPWATEVEAAYIPRVALRRYDPATARHPHIERGAAQKLVIEQFDSDWIIQRSILREHGVTIAGPEPRTLIDPVSADDLRRAVVTLMRHWWGPMRHDTSLLEMHHIGYQAYAILTMCRVLYTLAFGAVVSKPVAARWVQASQGVRWHSLIAWALAWRKDTLHPPPGEMAETLALIQYTLDLCERWEIRS